MDDRSSGEEGTRNSKYNCIVETGDATGLVRGAVRQARACTAASRPTVHRKATHLRARLLGVSPKRQPQISLCGMQFHLLFVGVILVSSSCQHFSKSSKHGWVGSMPLNRSYFGGLYTRGAQAHRVRRHAYREAPQRGCKRVSAWTFGGPVCNDNLTRQHQRVNVQQICHLVVMQLTRLHNIGCGGCDEESLLRLCFRHHPQCGVRQPTCVDQDGTRRSHRYNVCIQTLASTVSYCNKIATTIRRVQSSVKHYRRDST